MMISHSNMRRGTVAVLTAIMAVPVVGCAGLAIDYAVWNQTYGMLSVAANAAALNAVKIAATSELAGNANYAADGEKAGTQWFEANVSVWANAAHLSNIVPTVTLNPGTTVVAKVTYSGQISSIFGRLFQTARYQIAVEADATIITAPYLNVEILLDNSPSMEIGATASDIATMQQLTACSSVGALYNASANGTGWTTPPSGQNYAAYQCTAGGVSYDGTLACPIPATSPYTFTSFQPTSNSALGGPSCQGYLAKQASTGRYPLAGAPCAFACHFDTSKPAGTGSDYFAIARSTIGKSNQITLRFDQVKAATNLVISDMQTDDLPIRNLAVGIFTFDSNLNRVYPASGEAGDDWATASAAVGAPPMLPNEPDSGIQPYGGANSANTDFPDTMTTLATQMLTKSGDGTTPSSPIKVLFLVTDGVQDYYQAGGSRNLQALDPSFCTTFKQMGYTVYVVYTPYYPLMNAYYLQNIKGFVEGTGTGTTTANLQACASDPSNDYIAASDQQSLNAALASFLKRALNVPARYTH
ncbi:MAG TPA: vWA domain-containing protein [Acetobacteraceae bacterium]|nr:vWA domain-containing protein [Acetobacteraceae bacterium]